TVPIAIAPERPPMQSTGPSICGFRLADLGRDDHDRADPQPGTHAQDAGQGGVGRSAVVDPGAPVRSAAGQEEDARSRGRANEDPPVEDGAWKTAHGRRRMEDGAWKTAREE
ncbi:MAG: hypothetical protein AAF501_15870, partial [Pseudomonadota bacterium]